MALEPCRLQAETCVFPPHPTPVARSAPSHPHREPGAASTSWLFSLRPVAVNSNPGPLPTHTSQKPVDKGCGKERAPASCLGVVLKGLHSEGSPSPGSQKA